MKGGWLAASYYNSFEVRLYFSGRTADGRVEVIIMLSQLLDVVVVEAGAELGKMTTLEEAFSMGPRAHLYVF